MTEVEPVIVIELVVMDLIVFELDFLETEIKRREE
jgi:hypothetical protein